MKSFAPKFLALLLLVVLSASVIGTARGGRHSRHSRADQPREIEAYFQANVLPVLRRQRQKLEPRLSAPDRARLATYRTQLQAVKARGQALRQTLRAAAPADGSRPALTEAQQQQQRQLRTEARGIMLSVAQLAQPYEAAIAQLAQEVQPQKEQWAADLNAIAARNAPPEQQQPLAAPDGLPRERHGQRRFFRPATFLLLDPNAPAPGAAGRGAGSPSLYPNPAAAIARLDYEVRKAGPVTIDLLDQDGRPLRSLAADPNAEKGAHTLQLDLSGLPAGTYFYKIISKSGTQTQRFDKE